MAIYELTLNGITDKPFKITFEDNEKTKKKLEKLTHMSNIVNELDALLPDNYRELDILKQADLDRKLEYLTGIKVDKATTEYYGAVMSLLHPKLALVSKGTTKVEQDEW